MYTFNFWSWSSFDYITKWQFKFKIKLEINHGEKTSEKTAIDVMETTFSVVAAS